MLTNSKEQSAQAYAKIRRLSEGGLQAARLGSLSFVMPHIVKKPAARGQPPQMTNHQAMEIISRQNSVKAADWLALDVLVATVDQTESVLDGGGRSGEARLNPRWIVIEDCELMFDKADWLADLRSMFRHFLGTHKSELKEFNDQRKVLLYHQIILLSKLESAVLPEPAASWFGHLTSFDYAAKPPSTQVSYIKASDLIDHLAGQPQTVKTCLLAGKKSQVPGSIGLQFSDTDSIAQRMTALMAVADSNRFAFVGSGWRHLDIEADVCYVIDGHLDYARVCCRSPTDRPTEFIVVKP